MKAVVVELNKNYVAVLSDDGCITTIKNQNYEIGQVIQLRKTRASSLKKLTTIAASAAAFLVLGTGTWAYASPYSYVSVDVNPSIEFTVNRFDRVIKVNAVNDDGEDIINEINLDKLTNASIKDAIITTVDQISEAGYFNGTEDGIIIATSSENTVKAQDLAQELQGTVEKETVENGSEVEVEAIIVDKDQVQEAKALGVTPGKLNLVEKLIEEAADPSSMILEDWLNKSVKEIMKATKEAKKSVTADITIQDATENTENSSSDEQSSQIDQNSESSNTPDQTVKKAEKAAEKAKDAAAKAQEKAKKAQDKAEQKAKEAKIADDTKKKELAKDEAAKAEKEAEKAKAAAKEAKKAAEKAEKNAEKAKKDAEKAKKDDEKVKKNIDKEVISKIEVTPVPEDQADNDTITNDQNSKDQENGSKSNSDKNNESSANNSDNQSTDNSGGSDEEVKSNGKGNN